MKKRQPLLQLNTLAVALAFALPAISYASDQSDSKGFVADSSLSILNRNVFWNQNGSGNHTRDWSQALMATYSSGFTQGTVGIGIDAFADLALRIDGNTDRAGGPTIPSDANGNPDRGYAKAGGDIKFRVSNTTLKIGDLQPTAPVLATADNYLMPQTASGFQVDSHEITGLNLEAGHFTSGTGNTTTSRSGDILASYAGVAAPSASFAGGKYQFSKEFTASLYGAHLEDVWNQYYVNLNLVHPLTTDQSVALDFNLYRTLDDGSAKAGTIDTTAASLAAAYTVGAQTFTLAGQKVNGDEPFDYVGFGGTNAGVGAGRYGNSINLADSVQYSDFNGPGERSWQMRYDLDMSTFGVPGLSFMARHIRGSGIDGTHTPGNSAYTGFYGANDQEHETDAEVKYVVQSGPAKKLSFRLREALHDGDASTGGHLVQTRLITEYPLNIL
ncbi:imipenem/basic amino acid-specific outer membrane pore [Pseudomonas sp. SJZ103]|jgi:imipenem/basic amino acid-specific outer membrane pore|uniref:OprD family porin n=1 Tax=unclassified Pseudomonas TaxID=196821 RepID=UPI00103A4234|nr:MULTISPECIES: OprD family porin [unclassified Pseudomonas]MBB6286281.1 imipenem/basic amino acid-specific outer membrane pore [Pseudomonas sp. SJZ073]MBB6311794.1 imipenem/basic amino acid-specific outer membrane pore [Pseudomonas sp. JAI120]MCS4313288.1 imipenem/basic amino acid-specific outer membrane pore [Pseudomonas sp. BIGb0381]NJJ60882.1 OprD family porin [Pseudomonas sp. B14(2022)]TWC70896.1 imipenem/basic amino acid-specific outer membrane pore [Pseudomonas sp. SJZ103]